jgi:hypothetical protein
MNRLFELLLDNIVFVVIAIGFLSSFLRKVKQGQEQSGEKQSQGMPPFGQGSPTPARRARPARVEQAPVRPQQDIIRADDDVQKPFADWTIPVDREEAPRVSAVRVKREDESPVAAAPSAFGGISSSQAAQGIVWAEVLGPPRAKRPYGTRRG